MKPFLLKVTLAVVFYHSSRKVTIAEAPPPFSSVLQAASFHGLQSCSHPAKTVETGVSTGQKDNPYTPHLSHLFLNPNSALVWTTSLSVTVAMVEYQQQQRWPRE